MKIRQKHTEISIEKASEDHQITIEPDNLDSESDLDSSDSSFGLLQWRQKVQNADSWSYKKSMAQDEYDWGPSFTFGEFEDILQESNMEKTNRMIQRMRQRQDAGSRSRTRSPVSPRSTSRNSSADRGGVRSRNYSGSSVDTGGDYSSGQEEYFSAGEEETRPHGRSILTSRSNKVGLKDFMRPVLTTFLKYVNY